MRASAPVLRVFALALVTFGWGLGCVKKGSESKETGRGTASCNEWVNAYCDYSSKCSGKSASELCDQAKAIECKTDATAADCATSLDAATCSAFPKGCSTVDLADPAPAGKACRKWTDVLCTENARCGADETLCRAQFAAEVDCDKVIGVKLAYENCVDVVQSLACGGAVPTECTTGLFVVSE